MTSSRNGPWINAQATDLAARLGQIYRAMMNVHAPNATQ
jgi:hypothetical protein